ncbi:MAG: hypothetical protein KIT54_10235 [Phycisphaeraceae bacterium]|nr:hypothetical protein [Phycisphaeraceae bacterium]
MSERIRISGSRRGLQGALVLSLVVIAGSGCRDPLITDRQQRSPFQQYDRVRSQDPDPFVLDEFGRRRPNLTDRLSPR